ncbi:hypothetical protein [Butyrivibrio sp. AE3009]|uniref:hypothetical protein n=1 Tax=Butyrivibrio sp. AE3009 TaxID=1280666 RepID=UPI0003B2EBB1|nr:hypothetical protein [Butyrivibrio sp. AE3009]
MSHFSIKPDSIRPHSNTFINASGKLRQYSGEITSIMGELDGSLAEVKPSLEVLANQTMEESNNLNKLGSALTQIVTAYTTAESNITGNMKGAGSGANVSRNADNSRDGDSGLYDSDGQYGGNQMNFEKHDDVHHFLWFDWGKDLALYEFIRQHPGYENLTDEQIQKLLEDYTGGGCGWVADANTLFAEFEGREDEFEKIFGFPMYDKNGEYNYDMLAIDYYLETKNKFYIGDNDVEGADALANSIYNYYDENQAEFKQKYGIDLYDQNGNLTNDAWNKIEAERDAMIDQAEANGSDVVVYDKDQVGTVADERSNRMNHYLRERGIDSYSYRDATHDSPADIQQSLNNGQTPTIEAINFNLYDENGNKVNSKPIGCHAMVITGVTPDGKYIVSSWGERYIFDPNEKSPTGGSTVQSITVNDIYDDTKAEVK